MKFAYSKIGLACLLLSCPSLSAFAVCNVPCTSWTLGLGGGVTTLMGNMSNTAIANSATTQGNAFAYKLGPMGRVFAGFGTLFNGNGYLGAEVGFNFFGNNELKLNNGFSDPDFFTSFDVVNGLVDHGESLQNTLKVKRNGVEPTFDIKPGVLLGPDSILYARLGVSFNKLELRSQTNYRAQAMSESDVGSDTNVFTSSSLSTRRSVNAAGLRLGFGWEYMITPNLGFGTDYIYTWYKNLSSNSSSGANRIVCDLIEGCVVQSDGTMSQNSKAKVSDQEVLLQLIWHFDQ